MARLSSENVPSLDTEIIEKLYSRHIFTVYDFMNQTCNELMTKTGLSFKDIDNARDCIVKQFAGFVNAPGIYEQKLQGVMSTGIGKLDVLLEGGLHSGNIYEICGTSSVGKSQLCHWISTYVTWNSSAEVHYIDASRNFCASRIQMILETRQCSDRILAKVLSNIKVHEIHKINELFTALHSISKESSQNRNESIEKIVIIDSISVLFTATSNTELNSTLTNLAMVCRYITNNFRAVVVIVNTVKGEHGGTLFAEDDENTTNAIELRPSLGKYWLFVPNVRLLIKSFDNKRREISVWHSRQLKDGRKFHVDINDGGFC